MNLVDRYVQEVGDRLPVKQRSDIQAEIKSMVQDMLEEKSRNSGKPVDEALTLQVLKELGRPEKVATSYSPPRYLIGPTLYPTFWFVLKISLAVVAAVAVIVFAVRVAVGDIGNWAAVGDGIGNIFDWLVAALGWVVVTFAILERVWPASKIPGKEKDWDPAELLRRPDADKIPLSRPITAILFTLAALVIFNVFRGVIAVKFLEQGELVTLVSLSDAFFRVMLLINVVWVLTVVFHCATLVQRRWYPATRWAYVGLLVFGIVVTAILLAGPSIINVNIETLNAINTSSASSETIISTVNIVVRACLGIAIVVSCIQIGITVYAIIARRQEHA